MHFRPWQSAFWLALAHDSVEDGYAPRILCSVWPALDAITRREDEQYQRDYIPRCAAHPTAKLVKIADLSENMKRASESLQTRYRRALKYMEDQT